MTKEDALIVKEFKKDSTSYRELSNKFDDRWPEQNGRRDNHVEGVLICLQACEALDEDFEQDLWQ